MEVHGKAELLKALFLVSTKTRTEVGKAFSAVGLKVRSVAQQYANISPTQAQKNRLKKTKRKGKRKATATTRAKPGGLRRSIEMEVDPIRMQAIVFVAQNSEGGKYAKKIHDERYVTWRRLGPGSIAANKSGKIGEKFIERAIVDNEKNIQEALRKKLERIGL